MGTKTKPATGGTARAFAKLDRLYCQNYNIFWPLWQGLALVVRAAEERALGCLLRRFSDRLVVTDGPGASLIVDAALVITDKLEGHV